LAPELQCLRANKSVARHDSMERQAGLSPDQRTVKRTASEAMADNDRSDHARVPSNGLILRLGQVPDLSRPIVIGDAGVGYDLTKCRIPR
jgi:hypothetical protein